MGSGMEGEDPEIPEIGFRSVTEIVYHAFWTRHRAKQRIPENMMDVYNCDFTIHYGSWRIFFSVKALTNVPNLGKYL